MSYKGYPELAPDGAPWTLGKGISEYGVPVPRPIIELANMRTRSQLERERYDMRIQSARNWASELSDRRHDRMAEEWEAMHG